jgi:hypothetical protein
VDNFYRIYEEGGTLFIARKVAGVKATMFTVSYSSVNHRYWRIRHDASLGKVVFEAAADAGGAPGSWAQIYVEGWSSAVTLSGVQMEIKGGTWQVEANAGGKVIFDNFKAAKP